MKSRFSFIFSALCVVVLTFSCEVSEVKDVKEANDEFVSLFNGKNLNNWVKHGGKGHQYKVEDGCIVGINHLKDPNGFLCTKEEFSDFDFRGEFWMEDTTNSGIQFRSFYNQGHRVVGYQYELDASSRNWMGHVREEGRIGRGWGVASLKEDRESKDAYKRQQWNSFRIVAKGPHVVTYLNGKKVVEFTDYVGARKGFFALQTHWAVTKQGQKANSIVKWKNLRVKKLKLKDSFTKKGSTKGLITVRDTVIKKPCNDVKVLVGEKGYDLKLEKRDDKKSWTNQWKFEDGVLTATPRWESLITKDNYQDFIMHVEFNVNKADNPRNYQQDGNSGIYIQQRYEVQILNSYHRKKEYTHADCASLYKMKKPDRLVCKPHGQWQSYDIVFRAARFDKNGKKTEKARITVFHNHVLVHDDFAIPNKTGAGKKEGPEARPIRLQGHANQVKFRNVWIKPIKID